MRLARLLARGLVRLAAVLVPSSYHDRFVEEWDAELWHASVCPTTLVRRSLGAFQDALATRRLAPSPRHRGNMMCNCLPLWVDQGDGGVVGSTKD